jgi:hypothetical protein
MSIFAYIRRLYLTGTKVTDMGLKQLDGMAQINTFALFNTEVTVTRVTELKKALPKRGINHRGV